MIRLRSRLWRLGVLAVAAKGGRSRVAELIRQIEHGQIMQQREKGFAYDTAWLWEELGLDPAED